MPIILYVSYSTEIGNLSNTIRGLLFPGSIVRSLPKVETDKRAFDRMNRMDRISWFRVCAAHQFVDPAPRVLPVSPVPIARFCSFRITWSQWERTRLRSPWFFSRAFRLLIDRILFEPLCNPLASGTRMMLRCLHLRYGSATAPCLQSRQTHSPIRRLGRQPRSRRPIRRRHHRPRSLRQGGLHSRCPYGATSHPTHSAASSRTSPSSRTAWFPAWRPACPPAARPAPSRRS